MGAERTYKYPEQGANAVRPHAVQQITDKDPAGNTKLFSYQYDETGNTKKRTEKSWVCTADHSAASSSESRAPLEPDPATLAAAGD